MGGVGPTSAAPVAVRPPPDVLISPGAGFGALPAARGVVAFETERGDTLLLAVASDIRGMVRRRLSPPAPDAERRPDRFEELRRTTARVSAWVVGSPFEADVLYLTLVRDRLPGEHKAAVSSWQAWFVHVDAEEPFPRWSKVACPGWSQTNRPEGGDLIGPFRDKKSAGRYIETLDDLFDLCRYHTVLMQAPHGSACAYKEMGKCPAPCDGSETMASYKARLREAIEVARRGTMQRRVALEEEMRAAAAAMDFEGAERLKSRLESLGRIETPAFSRVCTLDGMAWAVVSVAERAGWARLSLALPGRVRTLATFRGEDAAAAVPDLLPAMRRELAHRDAERPTIAAMSEAQRELLGLIGSAAYDPAGAKRGRDVFIELRGVDPEAWPLARMVKAAQKTSSPKPATDDERNGHGRESVRLESDAGHGSAGGSP